ncbi:activator-dependent family glycosyltransferase [Thermobifida alba]|uniref:Activator-dependent family glycosyltransferase n=1 Tax=Thermobifida alba TaxID=53522 RepID=A0ABY4L2V6_THEAE|nr:activator-dependent family glycosyltransferase [Thermobifida alba]UPT20813.1 activator-dependent family glycosyltransferase [Thermobifida alba]
MRVLFVPFAVNAHVYAQVPLAWALKTAGHEVCFAAQPDVVDTVLRAGLPAAAVGDALDFSGMMATDDRDEPEELRGGAWLEVLNIDELRPERLTYDHLHGVLTGWAGMIHPASNPPELMDAYVDFARSWKPDLVVWDMMSHVGPVAARASGAAHARLLFGCMDLMGMVRARYLDLLRRMPAVTHDDPAREWLSWSLERYGCAFAEDVVTGQWTIDPLPASLGLNVPGLRVPMRYVPYNGLSALPEWLWEPPKRPRVCLTLGTTFREEMGGDRASVADLVEAVADLDVEVVATLDAGQLAAVGELPDNVRAVDFVPLNELLPSCSAMISHGGSGTVLNALVHGVPQIMLPTSVWCNEPKAHRIAQAGAGIAGSADAVTAHETRGMLIRLLEDPSFAEGAAQLRTEILSMPSPTAIVAALERLTAEHRAA